MTKGYYFLFLIHLMVFPLACAFQRNNPLDEGGSKFDPPKIFFNEQSSTVKDRDTVHLDTVTIYLNGNREQSVFSVKLDNDVKTVDWQPAGVFGVGGLSDGDHSIIINTMYEGGEVVVSDTINFHVLTKGFKPDFENKTDTIIAAFDKKPLTIISTATGAAILNYSWVKGDSLLEENTDTLKFRSFILKDTGSYQCIVTNDYGKDTSRTFLIKERPFSGGIKGVITDESGSRLENVKITLSPSNDENNTDSDGKFEFSKLSADEYSLKVENDGFYDTVLAEIAVNDTAVVDLRTIKLRMIDTTTFMVVYNGNGNDGGSVPVDSMKYQPNSNVIIAGNTGTLSKKGHSFSDWDTKKDGSGNNYSPNDSFTIKDNTTLYAQWEVNKYTLSFDGNNSTSGSPPENKQYGYQESVAIPDNASLKRDGYSFKEWNTKQNGDGTAYSSNDDFTMPDSNVVLFAQWDAMPTFKITYNKNNAESGTVPVDDNDYYEGKEVTVAGNSGELAKDGFFFAGWNLKTDGTGDNYNAGAKFSMPDSAVVLYAKWTTNPTYSITYHGNTNTSGEVPAKVDSDSGETVAIADSGTLTKTGYAFVEWNSEDDGSGTAYNIGDGLTMGAVNIDLYAQWTKAQYSVVYHGNGSTGGTVPPTTKHLYQSEVTVSSSEPTRTGYSFLGWNTESDGTGLDYTGGNSFEMGAKDIDLYARWNINKYKVVYHGNDNDGGNVPGEAEYEYNALVEVAGNSGTLVKTGYTFIGWNTMRSGNGTDRSIGSSYNLGAGNDTLFAKWQLDEYEIAYNLNGGTQGDNPETYTYESGSITLEPAEKTSYTFYGWYDNENLSGDSITIIPVNSTGNRELWAKWIIQDADGNIYTEVLIGEQVWMVENLKTTKYRDGSSIPKVTEDGTWCSTYNPAYCWYSNDSASYKEVYGGLYNFHAVETGNIAPLGWHVPTVEEWNTLLLTLGGEDNAGGELKDTILWTSPNTGATNSSGFSALPAGLRAYDGTCGAFFSRGSFANFWTSTEYDDDNAYNKGIMNSSTHVYDSYANKTAGYSVRCIRNW